MDAKVIELSDIQNIDLESRAVIAEQIGRFLSTCENEKERSLAIEIAYMLVNDAAISVRTSLINEVKDCANLPEDMVNTILNDIEQVSVPFIITARSLTDDYLAELLEHCEPYCAKAIAKRENLSEELGFIICDKGDVEAVDSLMSNNSAELSTRICQRTISRFAGVRPLMEKMAARSDLPYDIVENIVFKVSQQYSEYLIAEFKLGSDYAAYLTTISARKTFMELLSKAPDFELFNYLSQLHSQKGITSDVMLGYLQAKHMRTFIAALSLLLDQPFEDVNKKLKGTKKKALAKYLETVGFSQSVSGVLLIAYERLASGE